MSAKRHVVFGTAGHVDHGKSSLVLALTGTDPDRLAEEKAREMTIDLGFAFLNLPGMTEEAAIVDVPGHEMFVRNMVAGATGIDAAIFVVAADEGVMPQTVEHLDVLRFLNVSSGVIALTKSDKVSAEELQAAAEEVMELVGESFLADARIIPVSSITGAGLPELKAELARIAAAVTAKPVGDVFRLPIDRVFTLKGMGTVVTGTVIAGSLGLDDKVVCLPQGRELRVRTLHVHNRPVQRVSAGQRAAVNLPEVSKDDLQRGNVLATPGAIEATLMADARLTLSRRAPRPIGQRTRVRVHHGTVEVMARVVLLESDVLSPGESGLVQLRMESPLVAAAGDLVVLRSYSPMAVIGGGAIVDARPPKRKKGGGAEEVAKRENLPTEEIVLEALEQAGAKGFEFHALQVRLSLSEDRLRAILQQMREEGHAYAGRHETWFSAASVREMHEKITEHLARLHQADPLKMFVPLNALAAAAAPSPDERECLRVAVDSLTQSGATVHEGERIRLTSHAPKWTGGRQAQAREKILSLCLTKGLATPAPAELAAACGLSDKDCAEILAALVGSGELLRLAEDIVIHPQVFAASSRKVEDFLAKNGKVNVAQGRDLLGASRKYLVPFLEELDRQGVTVRMGDHRVLRKS